MKKVSLKTKLITGGVAMVLIPLAIVGTFAIAKSSSALESAARQQAVNQAKSLADMIHVLVKEEIKLADEISVGNTSIDVGAKVAEAGLAKSAEDVEKLSRKLAQAMKQIGGDYEAICMTDPAGTVYVDGIDGSYNGYSFANRDYFINAMKGKTTVGTAMKSRKSGKPVIPFCAPVFSKTGKVVGCLITIVKIDLINSPVVNTKLGKTGYAFMTDRTGLIISHPRSDLILQLNISSVKGMEGIGARMASLHTGVESYVFEGMEKIAGYAPVEATGWSVAVTQPTWELIAPVRAMQTVILIIAAVFFVLSIVAIVILVRSISKPIMEVTSGLKEGAAQMKAASVEVSAASQSLAEGASEQAASLEETSSALEEMASTTRQNADNAGQAQSLMSNTSSIVSEADASMRDLTASMTELSQASVETQKIVKTIDEIAFQTNLLALNAAVEAARAGEAGAGFAVVADEVRNLAMRAADAARNTAGLIEGTVRKIQSGSDLVQKTGLAFSQVTLSTSRMGDLIGEIAAASNEQAQGIEQINKALFEMDRVVQENASTAEESASASSQMSAQAAQVHQLVGKLHTLIDGQKSAAKRTPDRKAVGTREKPILRATTVTLREPGRQIAKRAASPERIRINREIGPDRSLPPGTDDLNDF